MTAHSEYVVYTPAVRQERGLALWRVMAREIVDSREIIWRLFLRDFAARYRQSLLGYLWALTPPIITAVTFTWLSARQLIRTEGGTLPYPLYVLVGTSIWQLFAGGLLAATQSLTNAGALVSKVNFPRKALVIASLGHTMVDSAIRGVLVAGGFIAYGLWPSWSALWIPIAVLPLGLFSLGLGFVFALVNGVARDAGQLLAFLLTFWMFLTPVVYPPSAITHAGWLRFNPVTPFVVETQNLLVGRSLSDPVAYAWAAAGAVAMLLLGWRVFDLAEPRIAERV
jgi:lipopolysaccharide transport system permease protein